jgi:hypothetical protein
MRVGFSTASGAELVLSRMKHFWRWLVGPLSFDAQVCPACWRHHVSACRWQDAGDDRLVVSLRCGSCGHADRRVLTRKQARGLEHALARHTDAIAAAADRLERERMVDWVDAFAIALQRDLIDIGDFARSR